MKKIYVVVALLFSFLIVNEAFGNIDVKATTSSPDTIFPNPISLIEDETRLICPDLTGFAPPIMVTNLACEPLQFGTITDINPGDECAVYTSGFAAGVDILCLEVCDANMCETFIFRINVNPNLPTANDDVATVEPGGNVLIPILDNDMASVPPEVGIIVFPTNGAAQIVDILGGAKAISYTPDEGFCDRDSMRYQICINSSLCDDAQILIEMTGCDIYAPTAIYNGFSPNNDGINDFFVVEGLEDTDTEEISIFNRWGNLVFFAKDYQNNWDGTWNGEDLPDGTYFYVIQVSGTAHEGFIQLQR